MTIAMINNDFGSSFTLNDDNRLKVDTTRTPAKEDPAGKHANPISPDNSSSNFADDNSESTTDVVLSNALSTVSVSEHKKDELEGRHVEEPLLKENPNRFVLFPIEDNEVR